MATLPKVLNQRAYYQIEEAGVLHFGSERGTPRPGRSAGGDDARTAPARGYEARAEEPHLLRHRDRLEKRPANEQIFSP